MLVYLLGASPGDAPRGSPMLTPAACPPAALQTQVETGSAITWKYPSVVLKGDNSVGEFYSVALTNNRQQVGWVDVCVCSLACGAERHSHHSPAGASPPRFTPRCPSAAQELKTLPPACLPQADTGTKMIHVGKNTRSRIVSKGICAGHSVNAYRGLVQVGAWRLLGW